MSPSPELLNQAASYLEQHEEAQRIQKLLFCLCKKYWENDQNVLDSIPVGQLLQELVQTKPSIEQVTFSMYKLVKTLNRPKVYTGVAKIILDQLGPLYTTENQNELLDATIVEVEAMADEGFGAEGHIQHPHVPTAFNQPFSPVKETIIDPRVLAQRIAQVLNQHPEQGRIKKLMFAVAKGNWENDTTQIDSYGFPKLILELRQMFPTLGELQGGFDGIVQNINKATLYIAIANLILKKMADLYEDMSEHLEDQTGSHSPTQIVQVRGSGLALRHDAVPAHQATAIVEFGSQNASNEPLMTVLGSVPNPPSQQQAANVPKSYNLFELRSEIMQYANPLRAKILLFSLLFNNWERNEDWSMLRSYSLDDLVEQVLLTRKSANDVETKLYGQAQSMSDREVYQQTAKTLIKVLKPLL